jgi:hypothetical protein
MLVAWALPRRHCTSTCLRHGCVQGAGIKGPAFPVTPAEAHAPYISHKPRATNNKPQETNTNRIRPLSRPIPPLIALRDSDIWAIYSRLCIHDMLDHMEKATTARDPDIESLNPGYAQPAYR